MVERQKYFLKLIGKIKVISVFGLDDGEKLI